MPMTNEQFYALPSAQAKAMENLQERSGIPWEDFLERCIPPSRIFPEVLVQNFHGMTVGIEPDGYTHS